MSPTLNDPNAEADKAAYKNRKALPTHSGIATLEAASDISMDLLLESIVPNSRKTYKTGFNHHTRFAKIIETNLDLSATPERWELFSLDHPQYKNFKVAYCCSFGSISTAT